MRIAFVGKGGSGKTTLAALFASYAKHSMPVLAIDADINQQLSELLLGFDFPKEKRLSSNVALIKQHLIGDNGLRPETFRKTSPPTKKSNLIHIQHESDEVLRATTETVQDLKVMSVGTYTTQDIGASCYHNDLAILENILSHTKDSQEIIVVDMVAGTDAFASSLHAQFDMIVCVVEPTKKSVSVYHQFMELANSAGVSEVVTVVANKIQNQEDKEYISKQVKNVIGYLSESNYVKEHEKQGGQITSTKLEQENVEVLKNILETLKEKKIDPDKRLKRLHKLHKKYVSQKFITERFGDLTNQIDEGFSYND